MKKTILVLFLMSLAFACKKKEKEETQTATSTTPANGTLNLTITAYDSLGDPEVQISDTKVFLAGTSYSGTCDNNGKISFSLPPGTYAPSVIRSKYEGVPFSVTVNSESTTNATSFMARNSPWSLQIAGGSASVTNSVTLTMNLNQAIPSGKQVKVAVLYGTQPGLSVNSYSTVHEFFLSQASNTNFNVCSGAIQTAVSQLPNGSDFYLLAVPVTYGTYFSNILNKNILVGDNLPVSVPTATIKLTKNW